ncbi:spore coat protein U domain-containing protein [Dongshaea marina]|uniref:spore coat protein U domain-containing protein n=1 Tax=Dongshaea marina TaxID=2047966 RepID=UPI000D3E7809|nr:spore coat protein U domain-containing protein [Dongshaea marina]
MKIKNIALAISAAAVMSAGFVASANAAGTTHNELEVKAEVVSSCKIDAGTIDMKQYSPTDPQVFPGTMKISCVGTKQVSVSIDAKSGAMTNTDTGEVMTYQLADDKGMANSWFGGTPHAVDMTNGSGDAQFYAQADKEQWGLSAGNYSQSLTVNVKY